MNGSLRQVRTCLPPCQERGGDASARAGHAGVVRAGQLPLGRDARAGAGPAAQPPSPRTVPAACSWGDAPVHTLAAAALLDRSQVLWASDIGYKHGSWAHW